MLFIVIIYFVCWGRGGGETIPPSTANKIIPRKKFKLLQLKFKISKVNLLNLG